MTPWVKVSWAKPWPLEFRPQDLQGERRELTPMLSSDVFTSDRVAHTLPFTPNKYIKNVTNEGEL